MFASFVEAFDRKLAALTKGAPAEDLSKEIRKQETAVRNFAAAIERHTATHGYSEALSARLAEAEATLAALRARQEMAKAPVAPRPVFSREQLRGMCSDVAGALDSDPAKANLLLRSAFAPIVLTPKPDAWLLRTSFKVRLKEVAGAGFEPATFGL